MKKLVILLTLSLLVMGCSVLTNTHKFVQENEQMVHVITNIAVGRFLTEHPTWASPTYNITSAALVAVDTREIVSVGDLEKYVISQIDTDALSYEELDIIYGLVSAVRLDIEAYLADRGVSRPADQVMEAAKVLTWINESAKRRI
jgi:hypothetical protein